MNRMTGMKTLAAVAALAVLGGCNRQKAEVRATPPKAVGVVKAQADTPMKATMRVQGSLRVKDRASVAARVPGTIDGLFGEEGTGVKAGDVLFTVDRENLENAVRVASNELAIALSNGTAEGQDNATYHLVANATYDDIKSIVGL